MKKLFLFLTSPWLILPIGVSTSWYFGLKYCFDSHHQLAGTPPFFRGSGDMGGSGLFAAGIANYAIFGLIACVFLILRLKQPSFRHALSLLRWHLVFYLFSWTVFLDFNYGDTFSTSIIILIAYVCSIFWILKLSTTHKPMWIKVSLSPVIIYLWIFMSWDGNTFKGGRTFERSPHVTRVNSIRHRMMLQSHIWINKILGRDADYDLGVDETDLFH